MPIIQLSKADGSWQALKQGWAEQCEVANEEFAQYALGTFMVLDQLAEKPEKRAGIYAIRRADEVPDLICQANCTPLPGHPEPVLRIRMVTVCPAIDFGAVDRDRYIETLAELFFGIVDLSSNGGEMSAKEFKLHLRSPEDFNFFRAVAGGLQKLSQFQQVSMHGAWLHVVRA